MAFVNWFKRHFVVIAGLLTLFYLLLPNVIVTVFSFNKPKGRFNYEWQEFSADAWKDPCGVALLQACEQQGIRPRSSTPARPW